MSNITHQHTLTLHTPSHPHTLTGGEGGENGEKDPKPEPESEQEEQ